MDIEKMLNSLSSDKLEMSLSKLSGILSEEQIKQVKNTLLTSDKAALSKKLEGVDIDKVKTSPEFQKIFRKK